METFTSIVHECFDEMAESYGMRCAEEHEFHVRYGNNLATFGIAWDRRRSYEIGLGISLRSSASGLSTFELPDILRFQGATAAANEIAALRVEARGDLREPIGKFATLTKAYAGPFLAGDPQAYASIAKFMDQKIAEYNARLATTGADVRALYQQANEAWLRQDYKRVVEVYLSITTPMPPFARERLAIAERKVAEDSQNPKNQS